MLPPQGGPRTWVHRVFLSCLCPIPPERHRRFVPQNFSIVDGYVVEATTTFGAHRGARGERIPFSAGPLFIDILIAAVRQPSLAEKLRPPPMTSCSTSGSASGSAPSTPPTREAALADRLQQRLPHRQLRPSVRNRSLDFPSSSSTINVNPCARA